MTIGLTMMVKNEEANIGKCIAAAKPYIDTWTILDTGSTDATLDIVKHELGDLDGTLHRSEFVNFAVSRSELFDRAYRTADYLLLQDADMQIVYPHERLPELTLDCYEGTVLTPPIEYALPILVKGDRQWRYEGVAHSYLACEGAWSTEVLPDLKVIDGSHTGPDKLRRDLELLSAEHARNPMHARTVFYLAQTYFDLDMFDEAIQFYRLRADMDGWDEETFYARYRLGALLCEHVSFAAGAKELLAAWEMRPHRVEPLRVLSNVADNVADKFPMPPDRLFVKTSAYKQPEPVVEVEVLPPQPDLAAGRRRKKKGPLTIDQVSAVIVTRGNVDLAPILETLPFEEVMIWDNSQREHDLKVMGRYAAIPETTKPVIFWQDDDVIFTAFDELLAAYEPGKLIANMDDDWIDGAGYRGLVAMQGAGSLCDRNLPEKMFAQYFATYPWDDEARTEGDFIFGVLAPSKVIDIGYQVREFSDDPDRLYRQENQTQRKWSMIDRCRELMRDPAAG